MAFLGLFCVAIFLRLCASLTLQNRSPDPRCLDLCTYTGNKAIIWHSDAGIRLQLPEVYSAENYFDDTYCKETRQIMQDLAGSIKRLKPTDLLRPHRIEDAWWEGIQSAPAYSITTPDVINVGELSWETLRQKRWIWRKSYVFTERDYRGQQIRWDQVLEAIELYVKAGLKLEYETRKHDNALRQGEVDDGLLLMLGLYRPYDMDRREKARPKPEQVQPTSSEPVRLLLEHPKSANGGLSEIQSADGLCNDSFRAWGNPRESESQIDNQISARAKGDEPTEGKQESKRDDQSRGKVAEREPGKDYLVEKRRAPKFHMPRADAGPFRPGTHPSAAKAGPVGDFDETRGLIERSNTAARLHLPAVFSEDTSNSMGYEEDRQKLQDSLPELILGVQQRAGDEGPRLLVDGAIWPSCLEVKTRYSLTTTSSYNARTDDLTAQEMTWVWRLSYTITFQPSERFNSKRLPKGAWLYVQKAVKHWCMTQKQFDPITLHSRRKIGDHYKYSDRLSPMALERGEVSDEKVLAWHLTRPNVDIAPLQETPDPDLDPEPNPNPKDRPRPEDTSEENQPKRPNTGTHSEASGSNDWESFLVNVGAELDALAEQSANTKELEDLEKELLGPN